MGASLTGFNVGLYAQEICFGAYSGLLLALIIFDYFEKIYCVSCLFVRCNYICLTASNRWISGAWFFACWNCCILSCNCMCRAQLLIDLFASCFDFCYRICDSVVALFFAVILCTAYLILGPNPSLLRVLLFARLPRYHFLVLRNYALPYFASSCVLGLLYTPLWQKKLVLWWSSTFCRFYWSGYCLLVLAVKSASCINLCLLVLIYLCVF